MRETLSGAVLSCKIDGWKVIALPAGWVRIYRIKLLIYMTTQHPCVASNRGRRARQQSRNMCNTFFDLLERNLAIYSSSRGNVNLITKLYLIHTVLLFPA